MDEDEPTSRLPDILDLLHSDPPAFKSPRASSKVKVKVKVDRKGKGKAKAPVVEILEVDELSRKRLKSRSPDALMAMGNHYLVEGLSSRRAEGTKKRARSSAVVSRLLGW
jgi:hypothetical protein